MILLAIFLLLGVACSTPANQLEIGNQIDATQNETENTPVQSPAQPDNTPLSTEEPGRSAQLVEAEGEVDLRAGEDMDFAAAEGGAVLFTGGQAQTGATGRARLDLIPDNTVIRMSKNTLFTVVELPEDTETPSTKLQLFFGEVWILLNGGSLEVETASGMASRKDCAPCCR